MPHLARSLSALQWPAAARRWLRRCAVLLAFGAAGASLLLGPMATASSPGALGASPETAAPLAVAQGAPPLVVSSIIPVADVRVLRPLAAGLRGRISWREIIR